ncbi:MAG: methylated-DNA--[protein]-cysteine S-methyltransferase [Marmoricola sp.]
MWSVVTSPVGDLRVVVRETRGVVAISAIEFEPWSSASGRPVGDRADDHPVLTAVRDQLASYFAGELTEFDLPLAPKGTDFQRRVWDQLLGITYGETASYGQVARRLGMTNAASRAVGLANGRNPIPIVIPCHRVIGADGSLTGYAGGVGRKQTLLELEQDALF